MSRNLGVRILMLAWLCLATPVLAQQSSPNFTPGQIPTASQWNSYFAGKLDYNPSGLPISLGGTGATTAAAALANLGGVAGPITTTGPYPGQVAQSITGQAPQGCLSVFTYLTPTQQAAVQAGTSSVDFVPIEQAMESALAVNVNGALNGTNCEYWPPGTYPMLTAPLNIKHTVKILGAGVGQAGGFATIWSIPANATGAIINRPNTYGSSTVSSTTGADGTLIDGVSFQSAGGTSTTAHGVWCRARCSIDNVEVQGFPGNAINIVATSGGGGAVEGNANGWHIDTVRLSGPGQNGIYVFGGDVNGGHAVGPLDLTAFQAYGIDDESFLGNQYDAPQCAGCGLGALVNQGGVSYYLNPTSSGSAGAATTPGTNPAVWVALHTFVSGYPAWSNSSVYTPGGGYRCGNNNARTLFNNPYDESGDAPSYGVHPCIAVGGLNVPGWTGDMVWLNNSLGALVNTTGSTGARTAGTTTTVTAEVGGEPNNGTGLLVSDSGTGTAWPTGWRIRIGPFKDMINDYGNASSALMWTESGPNTALTFGTTATVPYAFAPVDLMVGDLAQNPNNARRIFVVSSIPNTTGHAVGELAWDKSPTAGTCAMWEETAQGSPDTWTCIANVGATAVLAGTSSAIGGGALGAGACASTTVSITGLTTAMAVQATPVTYPGDAFYWRAYASSAGVATVSVCAAAAGTPTSSAYNLRVLQ